MAIRQRTWNQALTKTMVSLSPAASLSLSVRPLLPSHFARCGQRVTAASGGLMAVGEMPGRRFCPSNSLLVDTLDLTQTDCECVFETVCVNVSEKREREGEKHCLCVHACVHV